MADGDGAAALRLLAELRSRGFAVEACGRQLVVRDRKRLSPRQRDLVRRLRVWLLALVRPVREEDNIAGWEDERLRDAREWQEAGARLAELDRRQSASEARKRGRKR